MNDGTRDTPVRSLLSRPASLHRPFGPEAFG